MVGIFNWGGNWYKIRLYEGVDLRLIIGEAAKKVPPLMARP